MLGALVECYGERQSNDHGDRQTDEYEDASDTKRMQEALVAEQAMYWSSPTKFTLTGYAGRGM